MSTRDADLQDLRNDYNHARTFKEREAIVHAARIISNEPRKIEHMREALIRARRRGDTDEVKDINNWVRSHSQYQNER